MNSNKRFRALTDLLLLVFITSLLIISTTLGDVEKDGVKQSPNAVERAIGIRDPFSYLHRFKAWINLAWVNFGSPPTDVKGNTGGEVVKEAVAKSFETSKETAEKAAKAAGHAVHQTAEKVTETAGHAVHDTAEKVKRSISSTPGGDEEL